MALTLNDRVLETCTSPGTGAVTLLGATTGFRTFLAGVGNGNTCYYTIADQSGGSWEVGLGTYTSSSNTLARTTILSSSNSGSLVNFNSGTQNVFVTYPSEKAVYLDALGNVTLTGTLTASAINSTPIGSGTASTGAFTTLSASSTVSGTGFSNYLASPPAIGSGTPNTGAFTTLTASSDFITTLGLYSKGAFNGTYTDGIVLDYTTGTGRISVGSSDGLSIYNGGVAGTALLNLDSSGNLGLGVVPNGWYSTWRGFDLNSGSLASVGASTLQLVGNAFVSSSGGWVYKATAGASRYDQNVGTHKWFVAGSGTAGSAISFTQAMTLDASGNLGVATTTPSTFVQGLNAAANGLAIAGASYPCLALVDTTNSSGYRSWVAQGDADMLIWNGANGNTLFGTNGSEKMRLDSSGNLGLGVTPSGWSGSYKSFDNKSASLYSLAGTTGGLAYNAYYNGTNWLYQGNGGNSPSSRYEQSYYTPHAWYVAASGTAGSAISFTQAMTLDASGKLSVGTTSNDAYGQSVGAVIQPAKVQVASNVNSDLIGVYKNGYTGRYLAAYYNASTSGSASTGSFIGSLETDGTNFLLNANAAQVFNTNGSERARIDSSGNTYVETGNFWQYAPAPTAVSTTTTLTAAQVATDIIVASGTLYTVTLPTGTALDTYFSGVPTTNIGFDFHLVNTASGVITIAVGTSGMTSVGTLTVAAAAAAHFRLRRTAANTYVLYRLS